MTIIICDDDLEKLQLANSAVHACILSIDAHAIQYSFLGGGELLKALREKGGLPDEIFIAIEKQLKRTDFAADAIPHSRDAEIFHATSFTDIAENSRLFGDKKHAIETVMRTQNEQAVGVSIYKQETPIFFEHTRIEFVPRQTNYVYRRDTVRVDDILYLWAERHNIFLCTLFESKIQLSGLTLKDVAARLHGNGFFFSYRSHIINLKHFKTRTREHVSLGEGSYCVKVPLSRERIRSLDSAVIEFRANAL